MREMDLIMGRFADSALAALSDAELAEFRGPHGWEAFEQRIFVKQQILAALESDLHRFFRRVRLRHPDTIVIGTATDPYQPAERRFRLTRAVLARLAQCEGLSIGLITKSSLVARDADLFTQIQRHNDLEVHVSLITLDVALIRALEARSPMPMVRLRALKRLTDDGVNAGLIVAPVLVASVCALWGYRPSYLAYLWGGLLVPLSFIFPDRPLMSMPRFVLPLFPVFWVLAELTERWRIPQKAVAALGAAGLGLLVVLFVNWYYIF